MARDNLVLNQESCKMYNTNLPIRIEIMYGFLCNVGFVKQQTKDRGSHIVDELISIVQTLYLPDVKFTSPSEKVSYLASLNSSTVIEIKQYILQNWSSTTENAIEMVDDITNDGGVTNWLTVTWDLLFFIIIFVAIVGNLLVLWIVAGKFLYLHCYSTAFRK